jgi:hypothetical protein
MEQSKNHSISTASANIAQVLNEARGLRKFCFATLFRSYGREVEMEKAKKNQRRGVTFGLFLGDCCMGFDSIGYFVLHLEIILITIP